MKTGEGRFFKKHVPLAEDFMIYRKENIKIFHLNGCGPTPAQCGGNNKE